ncbi:MAG: hypothetical protein V1725_07625 [archaeon]
MNLEEAIEQAEQIDKGCFPKKVSPALAEYYPQQYRTFISRQEDERAAMRYEFKHDMRSLERTMKHVVVRGVGILGVCACIGLLAYGVSHITPALAARQQQEMSCPVEKPAYHPQVHETTRQHLDNKYNLPAELK